MRKSIAVACLLMVGLGISGAGSVWGETPECYDDSTVVTLVAAQHLDAGTITIWNDDEFIYVTFRTTGDWFLTEVSLAGGRSLDAIPQTPNGNPIVGQFPLHEEFDPPVTEFTFTVRYAWPGEKLGPRCTIYVAGHAVVTRWSTQEETAWGAGEPFPGPNWATYFTYQVQH